VVTVEWVFVGYTFSFGWHDQGFGNGDWVGFRGVGQEPNPDYGELENLFKNELEFKRKF